MTDRVFDGNDDASTPLEPEERDALLPSYITTRTQLNEIEQVGVSNADSWAFNRQRDVLEVEFIKELHARMFEGIWKWAGQFRATPRNIGVEAHFIQPELTNLIDDARTWVENESYEPDEIAIRFHHRLVYIHPFANGNGRHARLAADLLAVRLGQTRFSWGRNELTQHGKTRKRYITALQTADRHDIEPLIKFARS